MAIFGPNPLGKPLWKNVNFATFWTSYLPFFLFYNIVKDIFLAYIAYKKKSEKWTILDENHRLTTLEQCQFFDFLHFLFL